MPGKVTAVCDYCGTGFQRYPSLLALSERHYCSRKCKGAAQKAETAAKYGEYPRRYYIPKGIKTPSAKAYTTVRCDGCGAEVKRLISRLHPGKRVFCSRKCSKLWQSKNSNRVLVTCDECGVQFRKMASEVKRTTKNFCRVECHYAYMEKHPTRPEGGPKHPRKVYCCENCGLPMRYRRRNNKRRFCSNVCSQEWFKEHPVSSSDRLTRRVSKTCPNCHNVFERPPSKFNNPNSAYCSRRCKIEHQRSVNHPLWKGNPKNLDYGPDWPSQRVKALMRDGHKCQKCGITKNKLRPRKLQVHHVTPFREFGYIPGQNRNDVEANRLDNLITLCPKCHGKADNAGLPIQRRLA